MIERLAVVGHDQLAVGACHRLGCGGREVDDGEASVAEADAPIGWDPFAHAVRPACGHVIARARQLRRFNRIGCVVVGEDAVDATHGVDSGSVRSRTTDDRLVRQRTEVMPFAGIGQNPGKATAFRVKHFARIPHPHQAVRMVTPCRRGRHGNSSRCRLWLQKRKPAQAVAPQPRLIASPARMLQDVQVSMLSMMAPAAAGAWLHAHPRG
jgi:hypothetical protein